MSQENESIQTLPPRREIHGRKHQKKRLMKRQVEEQEEFQEHIEEVDEESEDEEDEELALKPKGHSTLAATIILWLFILFVAGLLFYIIKS